MSQSNDLVTNRRAFHDYEILETFEAGIALLGTEIKSLRAHGAVIQDAYVKVFGTEIWLVGSGIIPYKYGNIHNHEERRDRKLLMHKREIAKIRVATQEKGLTVIALAFYLKNGRCKVKIGLAKGKKNVDRRADIKERDEKRRVAAAMKQNR